jgi:hypothetical protein
MSALAPKADIVERDHHVRYVPEADIQVVAGYDCAWEGAQSSYLV